MLFIIKSLLLNARCGYEPGELGFKKHCMKLLHKGDLFTEYSYRENLYRHSIQVYGNVTVLPLTHDASGGLEF